MEELEKVPKELKGTTTLSVEQQYELTSVESRNNIYHHKMALAPQCLMPPKQRIAMCACATSKSQPSPGLGRSWVELPVIVRLVTSEGI